MLATKIEVATKRQECRAETIEEYLSRGGRIVRIEDHPDPEGRVRRRGARYPRPQFSAQEAFPRRQG